MVVSPVAAVSPWFSPPQPVTATAVNINVKNSPVNAMLNRTGTFFMFLREYGMNRLSLLGRDSINLAGNGDCGNYCGRLVHRSGFLKAPAAFGRQKMTDGRQSYSFAHAGPYPVLTGMEGWLSPEHDRFHSAYHRYRRSGRLHGADRVHLVASAPEHLHGRHSRPAAPHLRRAHPGNHCQRWQVPAYRGLKTA